MKAEAGSPAAFRINDPSPSGESCTTGAQNESKQTVFVSNTSTAAETEVRRFWCLGHTHQHDRMGGETAERCETAQGCEAASQRETAEICETASPCETGEDVRPLDGVRQQQHVRELTDTRQLHSVR